MFAFLERSNVLVILFSFVRFDCLLLSSSMCCTQDVPCPFPAAELAPELCFISLLCQLIHSPCLTRFLCAHPPILPYCCLVYAILFFTSPPLSYPFLCSPLLASLFSLHISPLLSLHNLSIDRFTFILDNRLSVCLTSGLQLRPSKGGNVVAARMQAVIISITVRHWAKGRRQGQVHDRD